MSQWHGEYAFAMRSLVLKDFRVRYRNMSLGVFWSLINPLIMMGVLTFVFTGIFPNQQIKNFPIFVLCGLIPFNFFALAWSSGTSSLLENTALIKRLAVPREIIPIASVLSNCLHLGIQISLLLFLVLATGYGMNRYWLWLPLIWGLEVVFVMGMAMACGALNVYIRDMRYVVESCSTILFWLVPIFYPFSFIPTRFAGIYELNPVAALVLASRNVLLDAKAPPGSLLWKLSISSVLVFLLGWFVFQRLKRRFYDYL
ncbi:MAG: ABC transporter permease [Acidobacteriia bacterium]|nr:ABC transporter permease [Terriglobia bacterium]